ncbi:hypothetical protein J1P26_21860 [Neobacillus sp. MM2021_6]|uniref:terminase small subunit n=1 Tax=Bacillaceae TaxID=186817 RepID=UPI001408CDA3|nr:MULTISPECIES: terminase small subunit [Bacillaceae]MBO0962353.1 hypothetical protein [Neobacillus sp. MM2021_6]NHC20836.1 hypothetical protein [Bacillus sp. MM2020_4]
MSNAGRPLKFRSVKALQKKIDEYFESCFEEQWIEYDDIWRPILDRNGEVVKHQVKPFTITGLASFLGTTRQGLINYEQRDEFYDTIKNAKVKIEAYAEEALYKPKIAAGVIFNLKNNFGWEDKQGIQHSGGVDHTIDLTSLTVEELRKLANSDS